MLGMFFESNKKKEYSDLTLDQKIQLFPIIWNLLNDAEKHEIRLVMQDKQKELGLNMIKDITDYLSKEK